MLIRNRKTGSHVLLIKFRLFHLFNFGLCYSRGRSVTWLINHIVILFVVVIVVNDTTGNLEYTLSVRLPQWVQRLSSVSIKDDLSSGQGLFAEYYWKAYDLEYYCKAYDLEYSWKAYDLVYYWKAYDLVYYWKAYGLVSILLEGLWFSILLEGL